MAVSKSKMYELVRATGSRLKPGDVLEAGGRKVKVSRNGNIRLRDTGFAKELAAKYGKKSLDRQNAGQLIDVELETYNQDRHSDPVKRTHYFTCVAMPWHKYDENGRRIR